MKRISIEGIGQAWDTIDEADKHGLNPHWRSENYFVDDYDFAIAQFQLEADREDMKDLFKKIESGWNLGWNTEALGKWQALKEEALKEE